MQSIIDEEQAAIDHYERTGDATHLSRVESRISRIFDGKSKDISLSDAYVGMAAAVDKRGRLFETDFKSRSKFARISELKRNDIGTCLNQSFHVSEALKRHLDDDDDESEGDVEDLEAWDELDNAVPTIVKTGKKSMQTLLKAHQVEGVDFVDDRLQKGQGALLAFSMGLGKTLTVLATLEREAARTLTVPHVVVISPSSVIFGWSREHGTYSELLSYPCEEPVLSTQDFRERFPTWVGAGGLLIMSFDMLVRISESRKARSMYKKLLQLAGILVVDEMHKVKNLENKRARVVDAFETTKRIGLTGTPLANSPNDFFNIVRLVDKTIMQSMTVAEFNRHFKMPIERSQYFDATEDEKARGREQTAVLRTLFQPVALHKSSLVLKKVLPPKTEYMVIYEIDDETRKRIDDQTSNASYLQAQPIVDREVRDIKVNQALTILDMLDESDAAIVFSTHPSTLHALSNKLGDRCEIIEGCTSARERIRIIESFQAREFDVLCVTTSAGACGINCQVANKVIILDPRENPTDDTQAVHRAWRLGQEQPVTVYRFGAERTVEVRVLRRGVLKSIMGNNLLTKEVVNTQFTRADAKGDAASASIMLEPVAKCADKFIRNMQGITGWTLYDSFFKDAEDDITDEAIARNNYYKTLNSDKRTILDRHGAEHVIKKSQVIFSYDADDDVDVLEPPIPIVECTAARTTVDLCVERQEDVQFQVSFKNVDESTSEWTEPCAPFSPSRIAKKRRADCGKQFVCRSRVIYKKSVIGPWSQTSAPFLVRPSTTNPAE